MSTVSQRRSVDKRLSESTPTTPLIEPQPLDNPFLRCQLDYGLYSTEYGELQGRQWRLSEPPQSAPDPSLSNRFSVVERVQTLQSNLNSDSTMPSVLVWHGYRTQYNALLKGQVLHLRKDNGDISTPSS